MSKKSIKFSMREDQYDIVWEYADRKGMSPSAFAKMATFYYMTKYPGKMKGKLHALSDKNTVKPYKV